jgi:hypothetical protein
VGALGRRGWLQTTLRTSDQVQTRAFLRPDDLALGFRTWLFASTHHHVLIIGGPLDLIKRDLVAGAVIEPNLSDGHG